MLEIDRVSVEFAGAGVRAVDDVSLTLPEGSRTAIVGETGSGKSVLLTAILRLLPADARISGDVRLNGESILQADKKRLRQIRGGLISYVPQGGGGSMNPLLRIGFQVGEPLMIHRGFSRRRAAEAAIPLLERFSLSPGRKLARAYPHMFSGGMRQRAMVAMGISAGAGILLADEPTKGLDERRVRMVEEAFASLREETLLCVTHDILFAGAVSDRLCVMYAAQQLEYGDTAEILARPLHPYTRDLVNAMPEKGMHYEDRGFAPPHGSYFNEEAGCRYRDRCRECTEKCARTPPLAEAEGRKVRCWKYAAEN